MNSIPSLFRRSLALLSLAVLFAASSVHAQNSPAGNGNPGGGNSPAGNGNPPQTQSTGLVNPLNGVDTLPEFLKAILAGVVQIGTIILIMMLVYVGFQFVAARGNAEKLQGAKSALVWTVIGGLILLGATAIQLVIEGTVNSLS